MDDHTKGQFRHLRTLVREVNEILGEMDVSRQSEKAADLLEAAQASNMATRVLIRRAKLDLETS